VARRACSTWPQKRCIAIGLLLAAGARSWGAAADAEAPAVTPYRPSVSTPAALSAPGWLEVEVGAQRVHAAGADTRTSVPYTFKLAFSPDWGLRLGGEAYVRDVDHQGEANSSFGDTSIVLKRRFAVSENHAFGLELGTNLATADAGLDSGSGGTDFSLNGIYSADVGAWHADVNLVLTRLGEHAAEQGETETLFAAAASTNVSARWGVVGEYSGTRQRGADSSTQWLCAASFSPSRRVTWDGGVARSRTAGVASWSFFVGATVLAARVF
jgi:hypothetical protein